MINTVDNPQRQTIAPNHVPQNSMFSAGLSKHDSHESHSNKSFKIPIKNNDLMKIQDKLSELDNVDFEAFKNVPIKPVQLGRSIW